eukprot:TRINITY_DN12275_c1_g13_i2.p1 TRINITY_DN12275_c1_g13~~TRINITY_DN12275_c1_g13_i2.p1  ORF type:complete len:115 (+),score=4.87 TRINITY_DN12275_c1_g13_i2:317-661(+)
MTYRTATATTTRAKRATTPTMVPTKAALLVAVPEAATESRQSAHILEKRTRSAEAQMTTASSTRGCSGSKSRAGDARARDASPVIEAGHGVGFRLAAARTGLWLLGVQPTELAG